MTSKTMTRGTFLVNGRLELYDFFADDILHCSMYSRPSSSIASMTFVIFIVFFDTVLQNRTMRENFPQMF